ncbi:leucyl-tRNA synthetase [Talaromyces islandicus]|uniref:leucine--tRNA ligase n=1 Tax=Talaromyces islandicus TaxID=28573 RepID=A0A0U1M159_TALIS|nr:leucyl-tRNA synthetase [Talaromyces islandicus]
MPEGLPIDHQRPLNATMAPYTQQILVSTGKPDWTSRIEDDGEGESWGDLIRGIKSLFGRGGKYADPYNNLVVTASSFAPSSSTSPEFASAFLFPAFKYVPKIPIATATTTSETTSLDNFARAILLPRELHRAHGDLSDAQKNAMTQSPELASHFPEILDIKQSPTILICGHGGRDMRCGIMQPVLQAEFERVLQRKGFTTTGDENNTSAVDGPNHANIAAISHVGGHKYAGNVIIYIPPELKATSSSSSGKTTVSPLAGKGIWYGRVEPRHVEGIVEETIFKGNVVEDHFRGGIGMDVNRTTLRARFGPSYTPFRITLLPSNEPPTRLASTVHNPPELNLRAIDKKWQAKWTQAETQNVQEMSAGVGSRDANNNNNNNRPKSYILSMFPYPSGTLHMGHLRVYTISDVLSRFYRMRGHDVLHPIGWDAFGLPAENAAIERGIEPAEWTLANIQRMKTQLKSIGAGFDWDRELTTCSPEFYKHTQRIFLMLHEKGLAYQEEALVNYDPVDKTVLANEQVDANGFSWRSGAKVEQLNLKQWFFRITAFKESLLQDLDSLSGGWPERVLSMQRHWLGKSPGAKVKFAVTAGDKQQDVEVFTTRPDTLYGVEYIALSLNHPLVEESAKSDPKLRAFLDKAVNLPADSKEGYRLNGVHASHPLHIIDKESPHLSRDLPVFVAPYVLSGYGEGAVMGVPGHDTRDLAFFKKNLQPEFISMVIQPDAGSQDEALSVVPAHDSKAFTGEGYLTARCWKYSGLHSKDAARQMILDLQQIGRGEPTETWRLRDWLISRQRYWGTPIPIIHCASCGPVPVPVDQLPVELPKIDSEWFKAQKGNYLESAHEWVNTECPSCGGAAKRDTDTMDTFVDSSWYYLRYLDSRNENAPFSPSVARPVDIYVGGVEHAILHLLYARFIYKFLAQSELFPELAHSESSPSPAEPFRTLLSQGMVHGKTYSEPSTGRFLLPSEVDLTNKDRPLIKGTQISPNISFEKMSKSKHNGVDPTTCVDKYGADTTRAHVLFSAPAGEVLEWDETKIVGIERWFARLWRLVHDTTATLSESDIKLSMEVIMQQPHALELPVLPGLSDADVDALLATHQTISSVSDCMQNNPYGLNTVISDLTKLTNTLASSSSSSIPTTPTISYICLSSLLRLLSPVAPAFTAEAWEIIHSLPLFSSETNKSTIIANAHWPTPLLTEPEANALASRGGQQVAVQINGKRRFSVTIPRLMSAASSASDDQDWIVDRILETDEGKLWLREKNDWEKRKRVIVVKGGKLVNVVF